MEKQGVRALLGLAGLGAFALAAVGCGEDVRMNSTTKVSEEPAAAASPPARLAFATAPAESAAGAETPPEVPRKIVYNAQVEMVVDSVSATAEALGRLVKQSGGYISETDVSSDAQEQRRAVWKVKVPVDKFDGFLASVVRMGEPRKNHVDSQDVTQEFYDLEARVANKLEEEKRLIRHLADSTGKLDEILTVERELSRVRGEVEQMQGRIRLLSHLSSLSTVTITAYEIKDYTPPVSPSFPMRLVRGFLGSLTQLGEFAEAVAMVAVVLLPWLVAAAILAVPAWLVLRRRVVRPTPTRPGPA